MLLSQYRLTFQLIHNGMPHFIAKLKTILVLIEMVFRDHLRDVPCEDIFKLGASAAAASEFCEWVQVGIYVCIPHRKYQVKPRSSPWFSAACAAAIVHRNHIFHLYQIEKSSDSKLKFRQASNPCKRSYEAAKLAYANKQKSLHCIPVVFLKNREPELTY